jgi:hypothetical protein
MHLQIDCIYVEPRGRGGGIIYIINRKKKKGELLTTAKWQIRSGFVRKIVVAFRK